MKKLLLPICVLLILSGCRQQKDIYPTRPKDSPYFYNETAITEMNQPARLELREARAKTGIEFVMVLLKTLPADISIEQYAAGLFHNWKIGSRTNGKGVLLLFIEDTHTLKIEVSYSLEGVFTDAFCSSFQPTIKSYCAGRYFGDVFCGLVGCMTRRILTGQVTDEPLLKGTMSDPAILKSSDVFLSGGGGIIDNEYYYEKDTKLSFIRNIPPEKIREFESHKNIDVVIEQYFTLLEEGINYPFLGILTEGSQMKRLEYPESAHFYRCRWEDCKKSLPYKIKYKNNLAAIRFRKNQSFPIFLRKTPDGFWLVDEARSWVSSWQNFSENKSGPLYTDHPWMFAFPEYKSQKSRCRVPDLMSSSLNLKDEISRLQDAIRKEPINASNYFELADILYWDCLWIGAAIDLVEKGLQLEPDNVPYRWLVIDMRYRFPAPEKNAMHFEKLLETDPADLDALESYSRHHWFYTTDHKEAMKTLKKIKETAKEMNTGYDKFILNFMLYMETYWRQFHLDRNLLWRIFNFLYLFSLPFSLFIRLLMLLIILSPAILTGTVICVVKKQKRKVRLNSLNKV